MSWASCKMRGILCYHTVRRPMRTKAIRLIAAHIAASSPTVELSGKGAFVSGMPIHSRQTVDLEPRRKRKRPAPVILVAGPAQVLPCRCYAVSLAQHAIPITSAAMCEGQQQRVCI